MNKLSLTCLGRFQAQLGNEPLAGFRTNKVQALLVYLATEPRPHRRESLMTLLWPGMPEGSARHNLRQILYHLNQAIPALAAQSDSSKETAVPLLLANRQTIQLNLLADVTVDAGQFERLLQQAQVHSHVDLLTCHLCRQTLTQAVALYQGDFLADFYLDDSNEFEEWAEIKRQTYRRQALDALETLTTLAIRQKAYPEAQTWAQRQLEIDNLRESVYRQLMEIHALNGRREQALALYETCHRLLADEWGMAPTSRTTDLYQKILAGDLRFDVPVPQGVRGYELKEEIGEGAYGTIYRAIQPTIGRDVAVKVIRRRYANDPEFIRRFETEAQTIARLEHPHIVPLYDYWRDPEGAYLVMRLLRGGSLLEALQAGPWSPEAVIATLDQIVSALTAAHRQGIVHRDIKPANILFDEDRNAYLSDFGIAKDLGRDLGLTGGGGMMGTPDYISPEQLLGELVTAQADQYSLGAVLYEVLTGERAFVQAPIGLRIQKHLTEPLPLISESRPDTSHQIDEVIQRATAKRPSDRFPDVLALAEAYRQAVRQTTGRVFVPATAVPLYIEITNPYKGLRAFQQSDAGDFYGREALVQQLVSRLTPSSEVGEGRFLAVVGPSGSGKSSVVKAGLIPALRQGAVPGSENWFVAEMVPGSQPLAELALALLPVAVDPPPSLLDPLQKDEHGLLRTLHRILPPEQGAKLLLVIDQFEELFTLTADARQRTHFLHSLLAAITAPHSPLVVVVTLRADFYDRPLQIQALANLFKQHTELVLPLTQAELAWAIEEPARQVGVDIEAGLVTAMIADVVDQPGALPLLQYALTELFERREGTRLTRAVYEANGGVLGALGRRAEESYESLDPANQEATRQLFLRLVTLGEGVEDTRRRVLLSELEALAVNRDPSSVNRDPSSVNGNPITDHRLPITDYRSPITEYGNYRLLTFDHDPVTREPTVEVAHEALLREWGRLRGWLEESRADVRLQRLLAGAASEWLAAAKDDSFLLRGSRLDNFAGWAEETSLALTADEQAFLSASIEAQQQQEAAEAARRQRESARELAAMALVSLEEDPERSILLALHSLHMAYTPEGEKSLHQALMASRLRQTITKSEELYGYVSYSPDGTLLVAVEGGSTDRYVTVWDAASGQALLTLPAGDGTEAVAISPDGKLLAMEGKDNSVLILDLPASLTTGSAQALLHLDGHTKWLQRINFSPAGSRLATASYDNTVKVWKLPQGELLFSLDIPVFYNYTNPVISPDNTLLVLSPRGEEGGDAQLFDATTGHLLLTLAGARGFTLLSTDGKWLITNSTADALTQVWDVKASLASGAAQEIYNFAIPGFATELALSPSGIYLAAALQQGIAVLWRLGEASAEQVMVLAGHLGIVHSVAFSPDSSHLVTAAGDGLRIWDISPAGQSEYLTIYGHTDRVLQLALNHDGSRLATASWDGTARIWDADTGESLWELREHTGHVQEAAFSPDGLRLVTAGADKTARVWDVATGEELAVLIASGEGRIGGIFSGVMSAVFSPDGRLLATAAVDGTARVWDAATYEQLQSVTVHPRGIGVTRVRFSPDGTYLAAATDRISSKLPGLFKVWQVTTGEILLEAEIRDRLFGLAFSPDGSRLAVSSQFGTLQIWDLHAGERLLTFAAPEINFFSLSFSPDGRQLAISGGDGVARIWDATTGELLRSIKAHSENTNSVTFSPDGSRLFTAGGDNLVRVFLLDMDELIALAQSRVTRSLTEAECRQYLHLED